MGNRNARTSRSGFRCMAQLLWTVLSGVSRRCCLNKPKGQALIGRAMAEHHPRGSCSELLLWRHAGAEQQIKKIKRRTSRVPTG